MQEVPMVTTSASGVGGFQLTAMRDTLYVNIAANGLSGAIKEFTSHGYDG